MSRNKSASVGKQDLEQLASPQVEIQEGLGSFRRLMWRKKAEQMGRSHGILLQLIPLCLQSYSLSGNLKVSDDSRVCARKFWTTLRCVQEKPKEPKGFAPLFFFPPFLSLSPVNRLTASPPHCGQCESNVLFS